MWAVGEIKVKSARGGPAVGQGDLANELKGKSKYHQQIAQAVTRDPG